MPQEVVKLFHSQQAQLKVLYVHLDDSHISPTLKCWVEDSLILKRHLQSKYRYNSAQTNEAEGTTWSRLFISLNPQSKVKHPNQVLTHLVKGIEQIHITCDVCFVGFHFWREPFRKDISKFYLERFFALTAVIPPGTYHDISQPTWPMPSCLVSIFRHLGVQPAVLASSQTILQKTQAQTSSCRGPPEPQSLDESDEIWSHSPRKKRQQNKSGNKNKQSTSII